LLEIRLNVLNDYVDKFVLIEAAESFNGKPKNLIYQTNKNKFNAWADKIIHYVVEPFPNDKEILDKALKSPNTGNKEHWWVREFYQKESLIKALNFCNDDDLVFVSDIDEIWNPKIGFNYDLSNTYRPIQTAYPFYLNNRSDQHPDCWTGTRFSSFKNLKIKGPNHFRTERETPSIKIENGGWHFSWLGKGKDKWGDQHPDNSNRFSAILKTNTRIDESNLPSFILDNKEKYKDYFLKTG